MARFFAQICTAVFLVATVVGVVLGNATAVSQGTAGGNLGSLTLHMTWARDVLDGLLLAVFAYVGFVAGRHAGRMVMLAAGVGLILLAVLGFVVGDTDQGSRNIVGLHFTVLLNIFDAVVGVLAFLAALGTIEDDAPHVQESIIRPGTTVGTKKPV